MPLIRKSLADAGHNQTRLSRNKATETAGSLTEIIKGTLATGEDFLFSGFGNFEVKKED